MNLSLKIPWISKDEKTRRNTGTEFYSIRDQWNQHNQGAAKWDNVNTIKLQIGSSSITIPISIANGGTNSTTALNNGRVIGSSGGKIVELSLGQIPGTATNDSASAGNVGEVIQSTASNANFPSTGQWGDLTSISLTAGDWVLSAQLVGHVATAVTLAEMDLGISTTSGNSSTGLNLGDNKMSCLPAVSTSDSGGCISGYHVQLASTTIHYLKYMTSYSSGQPTAWGRITAVRIR